MVWRNGAVFEFDVLTVELGMRDYYSLVKCVSRKSESNMTEKQKLINGIERNFGGQPKELEKVSFANNF